MSSYLFVFTIGPVQSFISQARTTQDLAAGSKLLSQLMEKASQRCAQTYKDRMTIIYPAGSTPSKPNRLVASLNDLKPEECGKSLEEWGVQEFKTLAEAAFRERFADNIPFPEHYQEQVERFLQTYWAALPYEPEMKYAEVYQQLDRNLRAMKNVRPFEQSVECGRKCALDGERNVTIYRKTEYEHRKDNQTLYRDKLFSSDVEICEYHPSQRSSTSGKKSVSLKELQPGEGLSAVSFSKRCFRNWACFPSTAKIALMSELAKLENVKTYETFRGYFGADFDEQLCYKESLTEDYFKKHGLAALLPELDKIRECRRRLIEEEKFNAERKHYALLRFDGDSMGDWLSGEKLAPQESSKLRQFHEQFSKSLGIFAKEARDLLDESGENRGKTVYAGGDDFLGFVNLEQLFFVLEKLHTLFEKHVRVPLFKHKHQAFILKNPGERFTFSAGIVIAHYKTPLSEVLKWSRHMEHEAKQLDAEKNAVGFAVLKHSGEIRKSVLKWDYFHGEEAIRSVTVMKSLIKLLTGVQRARPEAQNTATVKWSDTFIKNFDREFSCLMDKKGKLSDKRMAEIELRRLIRRACQQARQPDESWVDYDRRVWITDMIENFTKMFKDKEEPTFSAQNFISFLYISDFIARKAFDKE